MKTCIKKINNFYEKFLKFDTPRRLVYGFIFIILLGAVLLAMPFASQSGNSIGFVNALFTATSAVCVTGLTVANTLAQWTIFGKLVIIVLIQVGGVSFMTLVIGFFIILGKRVTLKDRLLVKEAFNQHSTTGMVKLVKNVIKGTILIESIGAVLLSVRFFLEGDGVVKSMLKGIFISISAFCNAGFDIIGDNSLMPYVSDWYVNTIVMLLIIIGGIGFAVWMDFKKLALVVKKKVTLSVFIKRLSLHTKIVLVMTAILLVSGFVVTFLFEFNNPNTLGMLSFGDKILASLFQSVTLRTAGFNTIDLTQLHESTKLFYILQMFVGGSPGGTAGGVKTVTMGVLLIAIISAVHGDNKLVIFNRSLELSTLFKSLAVLMLNLTAILVATIILSATMPALPDSITFLDLFFESASAVGTVGLTLSVTPHLTFIGKITIICCMFIGRLGPVTLAVAFTMKEDKRKGNVNYPKEKILVG